MSAFRVSAAGLLRLAVENTLADRVAEQVRMSGHGFSPSERNSWARSLSILAQDLADAGLHDVEVLIEYQLPLTSRRVDAILAGVHPRTGEDSFVVVELKQWSYATRYEDSETLVDVEHVAGPRLHPGLQVSEYCEYLVDFLGLLSGHGHTVRGLAYLHNAVDRDVTELLDRPATEHSRIFTKQRRSALLDHLRASLDAGQPGAGPADRFLSSTVRPSRHLLSYAASELKDRSHFTLLDEAHRIRENSVNRFTKAAQREGARAQLEELVAAARVPVFLLDEHQVVKPGELGSVEIITAYAERNKLDIDVVSLHDQFRCGGSDAYEQWVLDLLGLRGGKPSTWEGDGRFDLRVAGSPAEMEMFLAAKQAAGEAARITAGYCWPWSDPRPDGTLVDDVRLGDWSRPWNVKSDRSVGDAPGSPYWTSQISMPIAS